MNADLLIVGAKLVSILMLYPIVAAALKRLFDCRRHERRSFDRTMNLWRSV